MLLIYFIGILAYAVKMPPHVSRLQYSSDFKADSGELSRHVRVLSENLTPGTCENPDEPRDSANYVRDEFLKWNPKTYPQIYEVRGNTVFSVVHLPGLVANRVQFE